MMGAMIAITARLGIVCPTLAPPITGVVSFLKPGRVIPIAMGTPTKMAAISAISTILKCSHEEFNRLAQVKTS